MLRRTILPFLFFAALQAVIQDSHADSVAYEAGILSSGNQPDNPVQTNFMAFGLGARLFYRSGNWALGVGTRGMLTTKSNVDFRADSIVVAGEYIRRQAQFGTTLRRYLPDRGVRTLGLSYIELGFNFAQYDLLKAGKQLDFSIAEGETRIMVRGYAISFGAGIQFKESPLFIQVGYELQKYDWIQIIGMRKLINYTVAEPGIIGGLPVHSIVLTVGLANVF